MGGFPKNPIMIFILILYHITLFSFLHGTYRNMKFSYSLIGLLTLLTTKKKSY